MLNLAPPCLAPNNRSQHLVSTFSRLLALADNGFSTGEIVRTLSGAMVAVSSGWGLKVEETRPAFRRFGLYCNCSAMARCIGCEQVCPAEQGLMAMSCALSGRPVLVSQLERTPENRMVMSVQTYIPDQPQASDVWTAMLCPDHHVLLLVSADQTRVALIKANGRLDIIHRGMPDWKLAQGQGALALLWKLYLNGLIVADGIGCAVDGDAAC